MLKGPNVEPCLDSFPQFNASAMQYDREQMVTASRRSVLSRGCELIVTKAQAFENS